MLLSNVHFVWGVFLKIQPRLSKGSTDTRQKVFTSDLLRRGMHREAYYLYYYHHSTPASLSSSSCTATFSVSPQLMVRDKIYLVSPSSCESSDISSKIPVSLRMSGIVEWREPGDISLLFLSFQPSHLPPRPPLLNSPRFQSGDCRLFWRSLRFLFARRCWRLSWWRWPHHHSLLRQLGSLDLHLVHCRRHLRLVSPRRRCPLLSPCQSWRMAVQEEWYPFLHPGSR